MPVDNDACGIDGLDLIITTHNAHKQAHGDWLVELQQQAAPACSRIPSNLKAPSLSAKATQSIEELGRVVMEWDIFDKVTVVASNIDAHERGLFSSDEWVSCLKLLAGCFQMGHMRPLTVHGLATASSWHMSITTVC